MKKNRKILLIIIGFLFLFYVGLNFVVRIFAVAGRHVDINSIEESKRLNTYMWSYKLLADKDSIFKDVWINQQATFEIIGVRRYSSCELNFSFKNKKAELFFDKNILPQMYSWKDIKLNSSPVFGTKAIGKSFFNIVVKDTSILSKDTLRMSIIGEKYQFDRVLVKVHAQRDYEPEPLWHQILVISGIL